MKNVMVVSAHPDDELLGAGGTLLRHRENGDNLYWLIVTNISEAAGFSKERVDERQKEMEKIVKENYEFKRSEMTAEDAKKIFAEMGKDNKIEIIDDLGVDKVSIYQQGEFIDLCRGTHIPSTGYLKAFKLMSTAGAYWRGDSNNKML